MFKDTKASPRKIIAFCHIEKAAGTSLTHVLRSAMHLRYATVRPMHTRKNYYFTLRDLRTVLRLNPFLAGIGGHSVVPHSDLNNGPHRIHFITQLRDPVARATSQYLFWKNRLKLNETCESFLKHPMSKNFQVKKIAGCEDLDLAKENICKHFVLAGVIEHFDEYLVLLAAILGLDLRLFTYRRQNVRSRAKESPLPRAFYEELRERNRLDQMLYDWVKDEIFPKLLSSYPGNFESALGTFRQLKEQAIDQTSYIDGIYRNGYMKPMSGLIRLANGLPYSGSYSTE